MTGASIMRGLVVVAGLLILWQVVVAVTGVPPYILPGPMVVGRSLGANAGLIGENALVTLSEIVVGLVVGVVLGALAAIAVTANETARRWLLPLLVASQAIPVFALAPLLVLWLGYGMASKVAMAALIIFFPVAATFHDGLKQVERGWLDLARVMQGRRRSRADRIRAFALVRVPAALPSLASGIRVGVAVAPIGAVIGEWVGSGAGLGHLMLHANGRLQIDLMFAALLTLAALAVALYLAVDRLLAWALPWRPEADASR
jgi:putative hydroxymethylpyrimidine transport system permease protein